MATMREERANFRFLLVAAALLLVAAIVTVTSFASLVNAGDSSNAASANPATFPVRSTTFQKDNQITIRQSSFRDCASIFSHSIPLR